MPRPNRKPLASTRGAHIDVRDERTVHDLAFTERFRAFHLYGMGWHHDRLMVLDSRQRSPEEMACEIADRLIAGQMTATFELR